MAFSGNWADACAYIARIWGSDVESVNNILSTYDSGLTAAEAVQKYVYDMNVTPAYINNAKVSYYTAANGAKAWQYAEFGGTAAGNSLNSNVVTRTAIRTPVNTSVTTAQGVTKFTAKVGLREAGSFVFGEVVPAIAAAGWGITLGKTIDSVLYNANPDFWDAHGMSSLDPQTWNSITADYDGVAGSLFNLVFGLNGDEGQAYLDEDAAAYLALWMYQQGIFAEGDGITATYTGTPFDGLSNFTLPLTLIKPQPPLILNGTGVYRGIYSETAQYGVLLQDSAGNTLSVMYFGTTPFTVQYDTGRGYNTENSTSFTTKVSGTTCYYWNRTLSGSYFYHGFEHYGYPYNVTSSFADVRTVGTIIYDGTVEQHSAIDGIGDQDGAQLPATSGWNDLASTKSSLQQQYPGLWNNAKHNDYIDDQGNTTTKTYIPINLPQFLNKNDTQPTSGNRTQTDPELSPDNATKDLLDTVSPIIMPPKPENTPTGSGSTPDIVPPTGSASSLWAVYNPSQAQVDAFGSWLWSSNLVEQIKKLFNDPMQAIIGIHKVFATPAVSGSGTIKCGYIDSGVSSNIVSNQYTNINCGTVDLAEYFGDVFDYAPFTEVSLYLPFIGIVKLDTSDVMRSSINVRYHVDVITGACLADVKVIRDGERSVLYQYAGSCIVTYPLSSGSYASALTGVLSIAGGIVGTVASGGALAPVALGAAVGATKLHSDVQKSGSFTGAAGAMGSKKPYLIISRPQTQLANNFEKYEGKPANHYVKVQNCSGFIKVKDVHVNKTSASETEMEMIKNMLMSGIEV